MADNRPSYLAESDLPLPFKHLQLYSTLRDGLALLAFGFATVSVITAHSGSLTSREIGASVLCLAQGILYFFTISRCDWPISRVRLALYFVGGPALWVVACWLNPYVWWLGYIYIGQMFGPLTPQLVI